VTLGAGSTEVVIAGTGGVGGDSDTAISGIYLGQATCAATAPTYGSIGTCASISLGGSVRCCGPPRMHACAHRRRRALEEGQAGRRSLGSIR
jgi:hypothetical protein